MAKTGLVASGVEELLSRWQEIEVLQDEVRGHVDSIQELFARIAVAVGGGGRVGRKRRGRPPGRPAKAGRRPGRPAGRKRAPRGALKAAIHKLLAGGKPVKAVDIMRSLPKVGYQTASDPKVFYNTVYLALRKDKAIEKTDDGFRLKKA